MAPSGRLVAAVALVALIGAGCSNAPAETGSGGGEKPATTGSSGSNATGETGEGGDQNGPAGAPPKRLPEFSKCMRENGVEDFPDPDANGIVQYYGDDPDLMATSEKCDDVVAKGRDR